MQIQNSQDIKRQPSCWLTADTAVLPSSGTTDDAWEKRTSHLSSVRFLNFLFSHRCRCCGFFFLCLFSRLQWDVSEMQARGVVAAMKRIEMHPLSLLASLITSAVCAAWKPGVWVLFTCTSKRKSDKGRKAERKKRPQRDFSLYYKIHDIKHVLEILYVLTVMAALNMAFVHAPFAPL